jgi:uncharacterized protein YggT (Ycf19 family)
MVNQSQLLRGLFAPKLRVTAAVATLFLGVTTRLQAAESIAGQGAGLPSDPMAAANLLQLVAGMGFQPLAILVAGLRDLAETIIQFYTVAILVYAVLSWVAPGARSPAMDLLSRLCEPLLAPVRRLLPSLGGLDLSPLIILIGLQALLILLR